LNKSLLGIVLAVLITFFNVLYLEAEAFNFTVKDQASCEELNGNWTTHVCFVNNLTVNADDTLKIYPNTTIIIQGTLSNFGKIEQNGSMINDGIISNNNGGTIFNDKGSIINNVNSTFRNSGGNIFINAGSIFFNNSSKILNDGGTIENSGGLIYNYKGIILNKVNSKIIINEGSTINSGTKDSTRFDGCQKPNSYIFNDGGVIILKNNGIIENLNGGLIRNSLGGIFYLIDGGSLFSICSELNNNGIIINGKGSSIFNYFGNFTNKETGIIFNDGGGTISNDAGTITNHNEFFNDCAGIIINYIDIFGPVTEIPCN